MKRVNTGYVAVKKLLQLIKLPLIYALLTRADSQMPKKHTIIAKIRKAFILELWNVRLFAAVIVVEVFTVLLYM
jgi:hypothetical protein